MDLLSMEEASVTLQNKYNITSGSSPRCAESSSRLHVSWTTYSNIVELKNFIQRVRSKST